MKQFVRSFLIKAAVVFITWQVLYYGFILPDGRLNDWLTAMVLEHTAVVLNLMGYDSMAADHHIYIDQQLVVAVAHECNGLELVTLFAGFFLCFPGPLRYKLLFIPVGTLAIYLMNVTRVAVLALNYKFFQTSFEFNHKYTYVLLVYLGVFLIWRYWLNNYSSIGKKVAVQK